MTIDREMLAAYAEGQLGDHERAQVEAALATDPVLVADLAAHRALRERLQSHFAPVMAADVPQHLLDAVRASPTADIVDLQAAKTARMMKTRSIFASRWMTGGAIAASLALGLGLGSQWPSGGTMRAADGTLVAEGKLDKALSTQLASTDPQPVQVLLSLRNPGGGYCRVFVMDATAGLACRDEGRWSIQRLRSGSTRAEGQYRQADSPLGDIMAAAQSMAPEGPLDGKQERAALDKGWE